MSTNHLKSLRAFVRDLALGVFEKRWKNVFVVQYENGGNKSFASHTDNQALLQYIKSTRNGEYPDINLIIKLEYFKQLKARGSAVFTYELTEKALNLIDELPSASIFISYRRAESSALALLIVARMKEHDLSPYLDMHPDGDKLTLGSDWAEELKVAVETREYFIVLIGPTTLNSDSFVRQELEWALLSSRKIIPVWHNGFDIKNHIPPDLPTNIIEAIKKTNGTIVEAENPKQYNATLDELLARFNILP